MGGCTMTRMALERTGLACIETYGKIRETGKGKMRS